ncbi:hypothetical protein [Trebonia kvetii]|uniref:hypothetical protein n=1 Tax=Trebonia kvetii TaxID=2480626 RepID=UPI001C9E85E8|nr:hypothetical protein [Trebonia kvetii]
MAVHAVEVPHDEERRADDARVRWLAESASSTVMFEFPPARTVEVKGGRMPGTRPLATW